MALFAGVPGSSLGSLTVSSARASGASRAVVLREMADLGLSLPGPSRGPGTRALAACVVAAVAVAVAVAETPG